MWMTTRDKILARTADPLWGLKLWLCCCVLHRLIYRKKSKNLSLEENLLIVVVFEESLVK